MISIEQLKIIDPSLSKLTEMELIKIRELLYSMGILAIESFIQNIGSKNPHREDRHIINNMQK